MSDDAIIEIIPRTLIVFFVVLIARRNWRYQQKLETAAKRCTQASRLVVELDDLGLTWKDEKIREAVREQIEADRAYSELLKVA